LHCIEERAAGYVCVQESWADLVKKIRAVYEDEFLMCPDIAPAIMARIAELKQLVTELDAGSVTQPNNYYAELTQREWEVLRFIGQNMSNQEIAQTLTIELGTVKNHVHNLLRKLDVVSRKQAAQLARQIFGDRYLETGGDAPLTQQGSTWNGQRPALHAGRIAHG
jgi:DNA-binding NarL/FixJ family response regulator